MGDANSKGQPRSTVGTMLDDLVDDAFIQCGIVEACEIGRGIISVNDAKPRDTEALDRRPWSHKRCQEAGRNEVMIENLMGNGLKYRIVAFDEETGVCPKRRCGQSQHHQIRIPRTQGVDNCSEFSRST